MNCPVCGKRIILIFHDWSDTVLFEYHHEDDPRKEIPTPCSVTVPYEVGQERYKKEWTEMYG